MSDEQQPFTNTSPEPLTRADKERPVDGRGARSSSLTTPSNGTAGSLSSGNGAKSERRVIPLTPPTSTARMQGDRIQGDRAQSEQTQNGSRHTEPSSFPVTSRANSSIRASKILSRQDVAELTSGVSETPQTVHPVPRRRVIVNREESRPDQPVARAMDHAREIVRAAEIEAERIRSEAKRYIEAEKEGARLRGFEEGRFEATLHLIDGEWARRRVLETAVRDGVEVIFAVAQEVIGKSVEMDRRSIIDRLKRACNQVLNARELTIVVHPEDATILRANIMDIEQTFGPAVRFSIQTNEEIPLGGARLESEVAIVEANLATHLQAIRQAFEQIAISRLAEQSDSENPSH